MTLRAGTATRDITPPVGSLMAAFPHGRERIPRRAKGVLDPLLTRALALHDGETTVLLASVDLCGLRDVSMQRIRDTVCERIGGLARDHVLVAASHTHAGAETSFLFGATPDDPGVRRIEGIIADALVSAHRDFEPVTLAWGRTDLPLNHNRRVLDAKRRSRMVLEYRENETTGPVDPDLLAVRFSSLDGNTKALLYHYTAHALTLGPKNDLYSADYPGRASRLIEETLPGCTALFANGAAGNVHPRQCMRPDTQALERIGCAVGEAALDVARNAKVEADVALSIASERLEFPNRMDPVLRVSLEVAALGIGPVLLGFVPGEFFVEFQTRFKETIQPRPGTLVGYANGWAGYVPTREAYDEGGYGVDAAESDPPCWCRTALPPGAGETLLEHLIALAAKHRTEAEGRGDG